MEGQGSVVAKKAPDFSLRDEEGKPFHFYDVLGSSTFLLVFYPGDFKMVCTTQLCDYRNNYQRFLDFGVNILGVSHNLPSRHKEFKQAYQLPFPLLSDTTRQAAKAYGCSSAFMLGALSRATAIVSKKGLLLYRYTEPTTITHRSADELLGILGDLQTHGLL